MRHELTRRPLPRNVRLLGWVSFWNDVASEMVYPLLPTFLLGLLGGSRFYLGLIEGAAESAASLLKLWSGARSDRSHARKPFLIFGYVVAAVCRPLTALLNAPWQLLVIRLSDRAGKGIRAAPRDALVVDSTEPDVRGRAFGYQRSMDHLGAALGPVLATAFLLMFPGQLRWLFALTIVPGIIVVACVVFGVREPMRPRNELDRGEPSDSGAPAGTGGSSDSYEPRAGALPLAEEVIIGQVTASSTVSPPGRFPTLGLDRFDTNFRRMLVAVFLFTLGNSTDAFLLVRAEEVGVTVAWLPMLWCGFNLLKSSLSIVVGGAIDRYGARRLLLLGWLVYMLAYLGFAWSSHAWHILVLFVVYAVFYALVEPSERALVASLCNPGQRGLAFGWFNSAIGIAALPASLFFGYLYQQFGPLAAFGFGSAMAMCASWILLFVKAPLHGPPSDATVVVPSSNPL